MDIILDATAGNDHFARNGLPSLTDQALGDLPFQFRIAVWLFIAHEAALHGFHRF